MYRYPKNETGFLIKKKIEYQKKMYMILKKNILFMII